MSTPSSHNESEDTPFGTQVPAEEEEKFEFPRGPNDRARLFGDAGWVTRHLPELCMEENVSEWIHLIPPYLLENKAFARALVEAENAANAETGVDRPCMACYYLSDMLKADREFMTFAGKVKACHLQHSSMEIKKEGSVHADVLKFLLESSSSLEHVPIMKEVLRHAPPSVVVRHLVSVCHLNSAVFISELFRDNVLFHVQSGDVTQKTWLSWVKKDAEVYLYIPYKLRTPKFAERCVGENEGVIRHLPPWMITEKIVREAVSANGSLLEHAPKTFCGIPELVMLAVKTSAHSFTHASPELRQSVPFIVSLMQLRKSCDVLNYAHPGFRSSWENMTLVYKAVKDEIWSSETPNHAHRLLPGVRVYELWSPEGGWGLDDVFRLAEVSSNLALRRFEQNMISLDGDDRVAALECSVKLYRKLGDAVLFSLPRSVRNLDDFWLRIYEYGARRLDAAYSGVVHSVPVPISLYVVEKFTREYFHNMRFVARVPHISAGQEDEFYLEMLQMEPRAAGELPVGHWIFEDEAWAKHCVMGDVSLFERFFSAHRPCNNRLIASHAIVKRPYRSDDFAERIDTSLRQDALWLLSVLYESRMGWQMFELALEPARSDVTFFLSCVSFCPEMISGESIYQDLMSGCELVDHELVPYVITKNVARLSASDPHFMRSMAQALKHVPRRELLNAVPGARRHSLDLVQEIARVDEDVAIEALQKMIDDYGSDMLSHTHGLTLRTYIEMANVLITAHPRSAKVCKMAGEFIDDISRPEGQLWKYDTGLLVSDMDERGVKARQDTSYGSGYQYRDEKGVLWAVEGDGERARVEEEGAGSSGVEEPAAKRARAD